MTLVARRDFKYLILSPLFFVWTGISFIFLSYIFPRDLFRFASSYIVPAFGQNPDQGRNIHFDVFVAHISYLNLILLFAIPILTMKLLAEEKRNRTFDLLMSSPLSSLQMVLGKYLALLMALTLFLFFSLIYPLIHQLFYKHPCRPFVCLLSGLISSRLCLWRCRTVCLLSKPIFIFKRFYRNDLKYWTLVYFTRTGF